jgi:hypothetical protein
MDAIHQLETHLTCPAKCDNVLLRDPVAYGRCGHVVCRACMLAYFTVARSRRCLVCGVESGISYARKILELPRLVTIENLAEEMRKHMPNEELAFAVAQANASAVESTELARGRARGNGQRSSSQYIAAVSATPTLSASSSPQYLDAPQPVSLEQQRCDDINHEFFFEQLVVSRRHLLCERRFGDDDAALVSYNMLIKIARDAAKRVRNQPTYSDDPIALPPRRRSDARTNAFLAAIIQHANNRITNEARRMQVTRVRANHAERANAINVNDDDDTEQVPAINNAMCVTVDGITIRRDTRFVVFARSHDPFDALRATLSVDEDSNDPLIATVMCYSRFLDDLSVNCAQ